MWAAEALSQAGDQLARVALAILVFQRTNSAALTGLTYALTLAPAFLGGVLLSGLADRFPRREVMVVADVLRAVLIGLVAIPGIPFELVFVLVAAVSFFQAPFKAAQNALAPDILAGDLFVVGMSIRTVTMQTAQMAGFAGGGFLINALDPHIGLALDSITFLVSGLIVRLGIGYRPAARSKSNQPSLAASVGAGTKLIWRDRGPRVLVLFYWLCGFLIVYEGLAAPYAAEIGRGDAVAVGLILAADPLGSAIGALVFGRWVSPANRHRVLGALAIANCLPLLVCFLRPGLEISIALFALAGAVGTAVMIQSNATFTRSLPDQLRAQALGLTGSGLATIQGLSPLLAGVLADQVGTTNTVAIVGIIGLLIAIPGAVAWHRTMSADPERWSYTTER